MAKETIFTAASTVTSPVDPHTKSYSHINGTVEQLLDRLAVAELCKGWPVYRDASEWANYRSLFTEDGTVWTTWSGPRPVDEFIAISKAGKEKGVFIMHRECGTLAELGSSPTRAIGKMKATITHRFTFPDSQFDVDCDCRFIFFCEKSATDGWKAKYVKLFYEKDKVVPVDGYTAPRFTAAELDRYPKGYCFLGAAQARLGYEIDVHLPTPFDLGLWDRMYGEMEKWLDGEGVDLFWEHEK
ncbi:Pea pathogenicity protein 2 [Echria macrotheca]|uniref:Pea pathogenicity protein 2 n=1 Tax=Echria macrotheca TaxID=438768 RepID=A0AAJ0B4F5_9PEZI|nr:Pea pathogenicity protein 2 [Echria macrotheca]